MPAIWFLSAALSDVEAARQWYDAQRPGLGDEFLDVLDAAVLSITAFPDADPVVYRDARRLLLPRFPYCLHYRSEVDAIVIVACMHAARSPARHRRRLRG